MSLGFLKHSKPRTGISRIASGLHTRRLYAKHAGMRSAMPGGTHHVETETLRRVHSGSKWGTSIGYPYHKHLGSLVKSGHLTHKWDSGNEEPIYSLTHKGRKRIGI